MRDDNEQDGVERSESGDIIYRYTEPPADLGITGGDGELIEAVSEHVERHVGPIHQVFHEILSPTVHVDLYWVTPSRRHPYHTIVTSGMAERPMNVPPEMEDHAYTELLVTLPASWPVSMEAFEDENHYWPFRWLKILARFPHEFSTWVSYGHTIPNGDPPQPFAPSTQLSSVILLPPMSYSEEFFELRVDAERTVRFYSVVPLYREELDLKLKEGSDALLERFDQHGVTELIDLKRRNVARKRGWWPF